MIKNCYIHIPFCKKICSYCDFCKIYYKEELVDKYLDVLEQEIDSIYKNEELETIYIGGGTPSCLNIRQLERLFIILGKLNKTKNIEYTIEGNFSSTTKEKLLLYKKYGINRLSLGIESINKNNLDFLERDNRKEDIIEKIKVMKSLGFNNINVDLIYAIPNETLDILKEDIEFILSLDIEHISTYSLIIEKNTKLYINKIKNIPEDLDYSMYTLIINKLKENNYIHYEISNFAKKGYESRHNNCYWKNKEYYGFGLGASSYINDERITNTRSISNYLNNKYILEKEYLSKNDIEEYEVILGLRLLKGISLKDYKEKFNIELIEKYDYRELVEEKLLVLKDNYLFIPEDKIYISNEIIVRLLEKEV